MLVRDIIEDLQQYAPEEEIAVSYWIKTHMEDIADLEPSDANWANAVHRFENEEWHWQRSAFDTLASLIEEEIEEDPDIIASSGDGDTLRLL